MVCRKILSQNDHMNCKIITIEGEEKVSFGRPTICQNVRMGRLYSEDSKPKVS
jgi:hypothetical protein